ANGRSGAGRARLALAVTLAAICMAALAFWVRRSIPPFKPERLYLSPNVNLTPLPKVTSDDRNETAAALTVVESQAETARRQPNNGQALLDLASKAIHANDPLTVKNALSSAIARGAETDVTMLDSLGQAQIDLGLSSEALATYQKLIARFPRDITGY